MPWALSDSRFWEESHKSMAETGNRRPGGGTCGTCGACHGADHLGTVLSSTPVTRGFSVAGTNRTVLAGDPVACNLCHSLGRTFGDDWTRQPSDVRGVRVGPGLGAA